MRAQEASPEEKGSALRARSLPSGQYRFLTLVATATHRDSGVGAHAVGNACDALRWVGCDSVSCACYKIDPGNLASLHLLYQVRGDQPRRVAHHHHRSKHRLRGASPK